MLSIDFFVQAEAGRSITIDGWNPQKEASVEAIMAMVNGYLGVRAAVEEGSRASTPATFLNGVFDASSQMVAQASVTPEHRIIAAPTPELVVAPDWSRLRIVVHGQPLSIESAELVEQHRTLDMRRGVIMREWRIRHGDNTTRLRSLRCASLHDQHVLLQVLELTPEDWSGEVTLEAIVDGNVSNEGGVRHLVDHQTQHVEAGLLLTTATSEKHIPIAFAAAAILEANGSRLDSAVETTDTAVLQRWSFDAQQGQTVTLHKIVTVFRGAMIQILLHAL